MNAAAVCQDDTEAAKALVRGAARIGTTAFPKSRRGGGPDFAQLCADLGRNLIEGRLGILTAVFEAVSTDI